MRPADATRLALSTVLAAAIGVSALSRLSTPFTGPALLRGAASDGFRFRSAPASAGRLHDVQSRLESKGVVVSSEARQALSAMIGIWERHDDVRATHSLPDGSPNIPSLINWSLAATGANEIGMVPFLGGVRELAGRLGLLLDGQIVPVLYWSLRNEPAFREDVTDVLDHLRSLWVADPSIERRFTTDGVVDVVGFLKFANSKATSDPASEPQRFDLFVVREAIHFLETS